MRTAFGMLLAVATLAAGPALHAQGFAGLWNVEFGEWQSDPGAAVQMRGAPAAGEIRITVEGDSAVVVLAARTQADGVRADTLRGTISGNTLSARGVRTLTGVNTAPAEAGLPPPGRTESPLELELTLQDGRLHGRFRLLVPSLGAGLVAPVSGTRQGGAGAAL